MSDLVTPVLIFVGVIAVTVVLFGGWVVASIFRSVGGWLDRGAGRPAAATTTTAVQPCGNAACRQANAGHAQFCSRCGQPMGTPAAHRAGPADRMHVNRVA